MSSLTENELVNLLSTVAHNTAIQIEFNDKAAELISIQVGNIVKLETRLIAVEKELARLQYSLAQANNPGVKFN